MSLDGGEETSQERKDGFVLNFADGKMVWQKKEEDNVQDEASSTGGGGIMIRTIGGGDDIVYCDFAAAKRVEQRDFFDKTFIVEDSIRKGNWKMVDESKEILGHVCKKAVGQRIGIRSIMTMDNGKMNRKEIADTASITAWFSTDIPVAAGPEMQGQLPGLILELDVNNGRTIYVATALAGKADKTAIRAPSKGKRVSPAGFTAERNKLMAEMEKNNQGERGMQIRINN